jgi:hypothetical protein
MQMTLTEAKEECARWFSYLQAQEDKSIALQHLARERRSGQCDAAEGRQRLNEIQGNSPTVYDGGNLQDAVVALLKEIKLKEGCNET